jgi:hypothetical protein
MKEIRCRAGVLVKTQSGVTTVFDLNADEVYVLDGDAGKLLAAIYRLTRVRPTLSYAEVSAALMEESETFKESSYRDESLREALSYLREIALLEFRPDEET